MTETPDDNTDEAADEAAGEPTATTDSGAAVGGDEHGEADAGGDTPAPAAAGVPTARPATGARAPQGPHDPIVAAHHDTLAVAIAKTRKRPPFWAMLALVALPVWGLLYLNAMTKPSAGNNDPLVAGGALYQTNCSSCHGATGGGVSGPVLNGGAVVKAFPNYKDHLDWVHKGAKGYVAEGKTTVGANKLPLDPSGAGMPGFAGTLTDQQIAQIVYFERVQFGNEAPNADLLALATGGAGGATGGK
ncbi:MAG TPA: cytochrome c [Acidimicrobiales bacterium]|nr:cytochrome c [Acidimicrobiales bacterium]